ncbi:hypothetical protein [Candidatus Spongiisocius sp.]|uniref:hypothetical protein n=1 Tax=Candidatus Spongiisocius sp. TaxID=3101273 RepID=UPI003B5922E7
MRTTIMIDDHLHEEARRLAVESRRTLSEVINELLAEGLKQMTRSPTRRRLGQLRDSITIADDFNETPTEILSALDEPL